MDESINLDPKGRILPVSYYIGYKIGKLMIRYQFALGPPARSLVTSIALARFILHDELVPAFTCASLMGCEFWFLFTILFLLLVNS
jgi:uncharacterized protein (DUF2062 family)